MINGDKEFNKWGERSGKGWKPSSSERGLAVFKTCGCSLQKMKDVFAEGWSGGRKAEEVAEKKGVKEYCARLDSDR